jgi:hypothetical protein
VKQQVIRFAVIDGDRRGAVWRLWSDAGSSDVYLAVRHLGGTFKISLHQSGRWHVAYSERAYEQLVEGAIASQTDRFVDRWRRPEPLPNGCTIAVQILSPPATVTSTVLEQLGGDVIRLPNVPDGKVTQFTVALVPPGLPIPHSEIVGSFVLGNGETLGLLRDVINRPQHKPIQGRGTFYKGRTMKDLARAQNLRAIAAGVREDGTRFFMEGVFRP